MLFKIYLFLFLFCLHIQALGQKWEYQTPVKATTDIFDSFFINDTTGYAVGSSGYCIKTTDAGYTWSKPPINSIDQLYGVWFTDINTGYVSGNAVLYKTANAGSTWSSLTISTSYALNCVRFTSSTNGFVAGGNGTIKRTINSGSTWTACVTGTTQILYSLFFTDANTGYAVGGNGTILKTIDAGINWTSLTSGTTEFLFSVYFTSATNGVAVGNNGVIIKTSDSGVTWTPVASGTTNRLRSVKFINSTTGFIAGYSGTILKTVNGGSSWNLQAPYTNTLFSASFTPSGKGFTMGTGIILQTLNTGTSWEINQAGIVTTNLKSMAFKDANTTFAIGAGSNLKSTNGGKIWSSPTYSASSKYDISFPDANTGYIVSDDAASGIILKTTNGGTTWFGQTATGINHTLQTIYFPHPDTGYAAGNTFGNSPIHKTVNGGQSWTSFPIAGTNVFRDIFFVNSNIGFAVGDNGTIVKTVDKGITWTVTNSNAGAFTFECVYFPSINVGYASGEGYMRKSIDGGNNWTVVGFYPWVEGMYFIDDNTGYVVTYDGYVYKTIDGGSNWTTSISPISQMDINYGYFDIQNSRVFAIGLRGDIYSSYLPLTTPPTITSTSATTITTSSATLGGNVSGTGTITERGIVWATTANPTTANNKVVIGSGLGSYSSTVSSLPHSTLIHFRAYAIFSGGTIYGSDLTFTTNTPLPLTATTSQVNISCNGDATGSATVVASGETPFTYSWSPSGGSSATASNLSSNTYTCTITDAVSASIVKTFNITQPSPITGSNILTICAGQSITVGSSIYSSSGTYTDVLTAGNTCDSTVTTNLTVNPIIDISTSLNDRTISATATGVTYTWVDCNDNYSFIPGETNQSYTAISDGVYAVIITDNICSDTSACIAIITTGINSKSFESDIIVYPNPAYERINIEGNGNNNSIIYLYNSLGELVHQSLLINNNSSIDVSEITVGVYFLIVETQNKSITKIIVRQ